MATQTDAKLDLLRKSPFLSGCSRTDLRQVGRLADEVDVKAGHVLFREGTVGSEFFVVVSGSIRIERGGKTLRTLGPGDFTGDIALITERPRTATATAETDSRLLVLGHREFHSLMDQFPSIRMSVLESVAKRLRSLEPDPAH
jgi:CRP-like cAMP-binding protein